MGDNRYVGGASVMNARVAFTLALSLLASLPSLSITQGNDEWSMYGNNRYLAATNGSPGYSKWGNNGFSGLPGQNKWESRGPPGGRGPAGLVGNGHPGLNRNPTGWNKVDTDRPYEDTDDRETTYRPDLNDKGRRQSFDSDNRGRPQDPDSNNKGRPQGSNSDNRRSQSSDSDIRRILQGPDSDNRRSYSPDSNIRGRLQGPDSDNRRPYSSESNINRRIQDLDFDNRRKSLDPDSDRRRSQAPDSDSRGRLQDPDNRRSYSSDSNINRRIQSRDFDNREKSLDPDSDRRRPQTSVSNDRGRSQDPDFDNKKSHSSDSDIRGRSQSPVSDRRSEGPDSDNREKLDDSDSDNRGRPQASVSNKGRFQGPDSCEPESNNYPRNQQCRKNEFRCGSNECLPQSVRCDNEIDCRDGSDEHACVGNRIQESNSQESNNNRQKNGCVLPEPPRGGRYNLSACDNDCDARPGNIVPKSSILNYTCNNNYVLKGNTISVCVDNKWLEPPTCMKVCPPLNSTSVDISCSYKGETVSCSKRIMPGTRATLACKSSYKLPLTNDPAYREISCLEDGLWDRRVFRCLPECGTSIGHGNTLIVNGFEAKLGIFPWHVGIYRKKRTTEQYEQICGGNLISSTLVVSAAHCFYDEANNKLRKASEYAVAGGKRYRDWNAKEDYVQKSFVASIEAGARYMGARGNFANDIALLKLKTPFELTALVRPVCIDWDNTHEREQLQVGRTGKVVGWGKDIKGESTRSLQEIDMPFVPFHQCLSAVPIDFRGFLTPDKFCAGRLNGSSVCDGDSGGGLCFEKNGVWYLRGIVSVSPAKGGTCDYHSYVGFTYLSSFLDWIRDAYVSE